MNMHFKIDENLPLEIAEMLIRVGHDAKTVIDQQLRGIKDPFLVDTCKTENRILVTLDTDFSDMRTYPPHEFQELLY